MEKKMPKYVKTVVKKSSLIPWITEDILNENSTILSAEEKQLWLDAKAEGESFPGYLGYNFTSIGNTQLVSYEFDTLSNLYNYVNKTQDAKNQQFDSETLTAKFNVMIAKKIKELGLTDAYQVTTSIETT